MILDEKSGDEDPLHMDLTSLLLLLLQNSLLLLGPQFDYYCLGMAILELSFLGVCVYPRYIHHIWVVYSHYFFKCFLFFSVSFCYIYWCT